MSNQLPTPKTDALKRHYREYEPFTNVPIFDYVNSSALGFNCATAIGSDNQVQLGNTATTIFYYQQVQRSDLRDKADIRESALGLDFIMALKPVDYKWNYRESYRDPYPETNDPKELEKWREKNKFSAVTAGEDKKRKRYHHGFIAQDVEALIKSTGVDFGGFKDSKFDGGDDVLSLGYNEFIAPMVKAIQELKAELDAVKTKLAALEK